MKKKLPLLLLLFAFVVSGQAQSFDLATGRVPLASLDGLWRFHTGDNPAWATPSFDDSQWSLLKPTEGWPTQGYQDYADRQLVGTYPTAAALATAAQTFGQQDNIPLLIVRSLPACA